jgi:hypothetical protein
LAANDPVVTEAATSFGHYAEQNGLPPFVDVLDEVPDIEEGKTTTAVVRMTEPMTKGWSQCYRTPPYAWEQH